ncbi:UNVERIFIED_CONTAM: hypothetical protein GTU68_047636 [Idotea baltica]|nr:hypothetical protein [Idotea baltica]
MKLWEKAKKYGIWNPNDIDFSQDVTDWQKLNDLEKDFLVRNIAVFQAGEEAVTLDLLPLIMAIAKEGRLEEEMFLTTFLWEEAKHVDGFNRYITTVFGDEYSGDLSHYMVDSYKEIFYKLLPEALNRLTHDPSPVNMARASVTYNMIIEGVLAETGYFSFHKMLESNGIMPGLMEFVGKLKQDESRHIAYGIFLISRLVAEGGDEVWEAVQDQMNTLLPPTMSLIEEGYNLYDVLPFDLDLSEFTTYAMGQFQKRFTRLEKARNQSLAELGSIAMEEVL